MPDPVATSPSPWARRRWIALFAAVVACYFYFVPYFKKVNNPSENVRVYQLRAVVELRKLSIDEMFRKHGWVNDVSRKNERLYPNKAPGTLFLGWPITAAFYAVERLRGVTEVPTLPLLYALRLFGSLLPGLLFLVLFRRFLSAITDEDGVADLLTVTLAIGTMFYPYALLFVNHTPSAVATFGALLAAHAAASRDDRRQVVALTFVAGFLLAGATSLDYGLFPVSVVLLGYVFWKNGLRPPILLGTVVGAAIPTLATAWYHQVCWGSPFRTAMSYLTNAKYAGYAEKGFFGLSGPTKESLGVLISRRGLLCFSPIFLLGFIATIAALRNRRWRKEAIVCCVVGWWLLIYNLSLANWHAGWTVGPRYITAVAPFVLASLAISWPTLGERARRLTPPIFVGLAVASLVLMGLSSALFPHLIPNYANPFFEQVWPLWRDGATPYSLGYFAFGWRGHLDQIPFLLPFALLVAVFFVELWRRARRDGRSAGRALVSLLGAAAVTATVLALLSIPSTPQRARENTDIWLRRDLWEPQLPTELVPQRDP